MIGNIPDPNKTKGVKQGGGHMKTTTYIINGHTVNIHDPAETEEQKQAQRERMERAAVRFWQAMEKAGVKL